MQDRGPVRRLFLLLAGGALAFGQEYPSAFRPAGPGRAPLPVPAAAARRTRAVELTSGLFDRDAGVAFHKRSAQSPAKIVSLNLFDGLTLAAQFEQVEYVRNSIVWTGKLLRQKYGSVVLAVDGGTANAVIHTDDGGLYLLRPSGDGGVHLIEDRDVGKLPLEAGPVAPDAKDLPPVQRGPVNDDGSLVDLLLVYTPRAREAAGGVAQMNNLIALAVAETNQGYANSGVLHRIRLVHSAEISYTETGSFSTELSRLRSTNDGFMDSVHTLRNQYGADVVSLVVEGGDACGIGYVLNTATGNFAGNAFNVVARECFVGNLTLAHEIGHNMGAVHDEANSSGPGIFPYSYGYQQKFTQPFFRTIMAYQCSNGVNCPRQNVWSSPLNSYAGIPAGTSNTDNRQTLNQTRTIAAAWRASVAQLSIASGAATYPGAGGTGMITVTAAAGASWQATSNASWIAITGGASGNGNGTITYSVSANNGAFTRTGTISIGGAAFTIAQATSGNNCTVSPLQPPASVPGELRNTDCVSTLRPASFAYRHTFEGTAGQQVSFLLASTSFDPFLLLVGPAGQLLASDDNSGDGDSARIPASGFLTLPASGIYTIEVASSQPLATGSYTLTVQAQSAGPCTVTIAPSSRAVDSNINAGSIAVTAAANCNWTASSNAPWIAVTSAGSGSGLGSVTYSVSANPASAPRSGTITITGNTFTITQSGLPSGCDFIPISLGQTVGGVLSSASCRSSQRGANYFAGRYSFAASAGQQIALALNSPTLDTYLYLIGPSGTVIAQDDDSGPGLSSRIPASGFFTLPQTGIYTVEATTFVEAAGGSYSVALTGGCTFTVSPLSQTFSSLTSTGSVSVATTSGCSWSAVSNTSWIVVPAGATVAGAGSAAFLVQANNTGRSRLGTLTVAGSVVTVVQGPGAAGCVVNPSDRSLTTTDCFSFGRGSGYFADRFSFTAAAGQRVVISLDSTAFDPFLFLLGPAGNIVTQDDDGGPGNNSRIPAIQGQFTLPAAGTYIVEATSYGAGTTGGYTLRIDLEPGSATGTPLLLYPLAPCRVADTRAGFGLSGAFGPPGLAAGAVRSFRLPQSQCGVPATARAYSLNVTVVPPGPLAFVTVWPADQPRPQTSTLNSFAGQIVANAAIVPAAADGSISVFASDATEVILDINGYFAP